MLISYFRFEWNKKIYIKCKFIEMYLNFIVKNKIINLIIVCVKFIVIISFINKVIDVDKSYWNVWLYSYKVINI